MKIIFKLITIITAAAMLCACGSDTRKEETMEENKDKTEITAGMSEEDKASFASGIKTEDEGNVATPAVEATSDALYREQLFGSYGQGQHISCRRLDGRP